MKQQGSLAYLSFFEMLAYSLIPEQVKLCTWKRVQLEGNQKLHFYLDLGTVG